MEAAKVEARLHDVEAKLKKIDGPSVREPTREPADLSWRPPWNDSIDDPYRSRHTGTSSDRYHPSQRQEPSVNLEDRIKQLELAQWEARLRKLEVAKGSPRTPHEISPIFSSSSPKGDRQANHHGEWRASPFHQVRIRDDIRSIDTPESHVPTYEQIREAAYIGLFGESYRNERASVWGSPRVSHRSEVDNNAPLSVSWIADRNGKQQLHTIQAFLSDDESTVLQRMYSKVTFDLNSAYLVAKVDNRAQPLHGRSLGEVGFRDGDILQMRFRGAAPQSHPPVPYGGLRGL